MKCSTSSWLKENKQKHLIHSRATLFTLDIRTGLKLALLCPTELSQITIIFIGNQLLAQWNAQNCNLTRNQSKVFCDSNQWSQLESGPDLSRTSTRDAWFLFQMFGYKDGNEGLKDPGRRGRRRSEEPWSGERSIFDLYVDDSIPRQGFTERHLKNFLGPLFPIFRRYASGPVHGSLFQGV